MNTRCNNATDCLKLGFILNKGVHYTCTYGTKDPNTKYCGLLRS